MRSVTAIWAKRGQRVGICQGFGLGCGDFALVMASGLCGRGCFSIQAFALQPLARLQISSLAECSRRCLPGLNRQLLSGVPLSLCGPGICRSASWFSGSRAFLAERWTNSGANFFLMSNVYLLSCLLSSPPPGQNAGIQQHYCATAALIDVQDAPAAVIVIVLQ